MDSYPAVPGRNRSGLAPSRQTEPGLTWVGGERDYADLDETSRKNFAASSSGTSIFDPVLTELAYRWFCPPRGVILDPFAGGSVRGLVASVLGYAYHGVELRVEQVIANNAQMHIAKTPTPTWHCGDSRDIGTICNGLAADFVFSCPPYGNLEVYSDDPRDVSTLETGAFFDAYALIIKETVALLKPDRFACFVVGDYRDKRGLYTGLPWRTIAAFEQAGLRLYNEAVLVTALGSLPIRTGKQFKSGRKLGKTHQNVVVFVKGDPKRAARAINAGQPIFGGEPS